MPLLLPPGLALLLLLLALELEISPNARRWGRFGCCFGVLILDDVGFVTVDDEWFLMFELLLEFKAFSF